MECWSSCVGPCVGESRIRTNWFTRERRVARGLCGQEGVDPPNSSLVFPHGDPLWQRLDLDFIGRFINIRPVFSSGPESSVESNCACFAPPFPLCSAAYCCLAVHVPSHDSATAPDPCRLRWVRAHWLRGEAALGSLALRK